MIRLELPLAPSMNRLWRVGKGGKMYKSKEYTDWLEEAGWFCREQTKNIIIGQYLLHIAAVKPDRRKRDLDNLLKATSDLLERMKIIENDADCRGIAAEWVAEGPPMIVTVYSIEEVPEAWNPKHLLN